MKAIETEYKGYKFRSRIEARWAVFFDTLEIKWDYEPEGFDLDGVWYLPDFWLREHKYWVEIKGAKPTRDEMEKAKRLGLAGVRFKNGRWAGWEHAAVVVLQGQMSDFSATYYIPVMKSEVVISWEQLSYREGFSIDFEVYCRDEELFEDCRNLFVEAVKAYDDPQILSGRINDDLSHRFEIDDFEVVSRKFDREILFAWWNLPEHIRDKIWSHQRITEIRRSEFRSLIGAHRCEPQHKKDFEDYDGGDLLHFCGLDYVSTAEYPEVFRDAFTAAQQARF